MNEHILGNLDSLHVARVKRHRFPVEECAHLHVTVIDAIEGGRCNDCGAEVIYRPEIRNWVHDQR